MKRLFDRIRDYINDLFIQERNNNYDMIKMNYYQYLYQQIKSSGMKI